MIGITEKSSVAVIPLWSPQKQNSWVKRTENNMKSIVGISVIVYWRFYLRWVTWNKSRKIKISVKVVFAMFFAKPISHISSSSTVDLILHLQYYQKCEPMFLKMLAKSKFVLCKPRYNLLTEKKYKRNTVTVLKKCSFIVKFSYFDGRPNKVK